MSSNPSICIPRIESNITKKIITNAFEKFGNVDRIDIVNSGRRSRKAFIHFKRWIPRTQCHQSFLTRLECGETVNLMYCFPCIGSVVKVSFQSHYITTTV